MKNLLFLLMLSASLAFITTACEDDDETTIINEGRPTGNFSIQRSGVLVAQNGTPTQGDVEIGTDDDGEQFVRFGSNFRTELATGTVTIYLSKGQTIQFDPANGNPSIRAIGIVVDNGEDFFRVEKPVGNDFTHVVLWCASAGIPFGYALLQ